MIDIAVEQPLELTRAHAWLVQLGFRVSLQVFYRLCKTGAIETVAIGGRKYTTKEALQRHAERNRAPQQKGRTVEAQRRAEQDRAYLKAKYGI